MNKGNSPAQSTGYIHLHNHTEYSLLDGAVRIDELIHKSKEYNMSAVAMTDHGVLYGIIEFYQKAKKAGIKPVIGCEVYITPNSRFDKDTRTLYHLVLIAHNKKGYHNLIKIVSKSWLEGFYYKPRADKDLLYQHRQGLTALSGCIQGEISQNILNDNLKKAGEILKNYQAIFGSENFYLELQDHNLRKEKKVNSKLINLSNKTGTPLVVTNDIHYLNHQDDDLHDILLAMQTGKTVEDEDRMSFEGDQFYFKDKQEMKALFPEIESAYKNTVKIAEKCELELDFKSFYLPDYPDLKNNESPLDLLKEKCRKGLKAKGLQNNETAEKRLKYEIKIIQQMGYVSYFLIVEDFITYAQNNNIRVGPGRGSAAGSLVSYLLDITKINPLKYDLIFERFLNPERVSMPDIDIDFDERRDEIITYVKKRYGKEKVAQIGTFGTMAARAAVRDVGRVLNIPYNKVDRIAKMISSREELKDAVKKNERLHQMYQEDKEVKKIIDYAVRIEGMPRHISTHAAGVIIGPEDLSNLVPLQFQDDNIITQLPMEELEDLGLLKMDFLGLRNLTIINKALNLIEKRTGKTIAIDNIPLDDNSVYEMLSRGDTLGVFQMESYLFQDLNRRLKPEKFEDLIALLALGRPGPLGSGMVDDFIKSRHGEKEPEYLHPCLQPILEETYGMILYQEQVMKIASELADYSMGEADILRRGMGKKKQEVVAQERERFVQGAQKNGIDKEIADEIFDQMEYFGGYGFNKSHSAAYAYLAYQTAYLKANYPAEFMAALLSTVMNNLDKVGKYIRECKNMGIEVLPPDINESGLEFQTNHKGQIRFGLKAIKHVGSGAIKSIIENRKKEKYKSLLDFMEKVDLKSLNITALEALIKAGVMDNLGIKRSQMLLKFDEIYEKVSSHKKNYTTGQTSFFDLVEDKDKFYKNEIEYPEIDELSNQDKLNQEKEYLGIFISGHPLDEYKEKIKRFRTTPCESIENISDKVNITVAGMVINHKEHITRRNNKMGFITIEDKTGRAEIVVFPELYKSAVFALENGNIVLISGYRDDDSFIAHKVISLNKQILEINIDGLSKNQIKNSKKVIENFSGDTPVIFRKGTNLILVDNNFWVKFNSKFESRLKQYINKNYHIFK
ncbi:MAG: DNA polymerase III subunit alpha [Bacillota bacterium]